MEGGVIDIDEGNDDEQIVVAPCPSSSLVSLGGGGSHVETTKMTTSDLRLDAREVVVVGVALKRRK